MSSNPNTTEFTKPDSSTTPLTPLPTPAQRPFVMPKLVKQGKVATLTGFDGGLEGGGSDIPPGDVP